MTAVDASMRAVMDEAIPRASAMVGGEEQDCTQAGQKVLVFGIVTGTRCTRFCLGRSQSHSLTAIMLPGSGLAWPSSLALHCGNRCQSLTIARPSEP